MMNHTSGEVVWLENGVIQRVGALQLQPTDTGASHRSDMNLNTAPTKKDCFRQETNISKSFIMMSGISLYCLNMT